jgi:hypothetical protein
MRGFALLAVCSLTMLLVGCGASATSSDKPADATPPTSTSKASAASPGETYYWGENIRGREYSAMPSTPYAIYPLNSPSSTGALAVQVAITRARREPKYSPTRRRRQPSRSIQVQLLWWFLEATEQTILVHSTIAAL